MKWKISIREEDDHQFHARATRNHWWYDPWGTCLYAKDVREAQVREDINRLICEFEAREKRNQKKDRRYSFNSKSCK